MDCGNSRVNSHRMESYLGEGSLSLQQGRVFLPLLFVIFLFAGSLATAPPCFSLIQTPPSLNALEGATLNMSCKFNGNTTSVWYFKWFHNTSDGPRELENSSKTRIFINIDARLSILILKRVDINDSGTYQCHFGDTQNRKLHSNGTQVIINEITDLMVNQTPEQLSKMEGENVTIECYFRTVSNISTMYVRWRKNTTELKNKTGSCIIIQDLEKGFTSLTLMNADKDDSGVYRCEVGSSLRNRSGSGHGSYVAITAQHNKQLDSEITKENTGTGFGVGAGAGAGAMIFLLLLLLSIMVWRYKKKRAKGTPGLSSDTEIVPAKKVKKHPPVTGRVSEVTYADLNFHRREVQPAGEVIYAEVRRGAKQQGGNSSRVRPKPARPI